jgi:hypothetical protein
MVIDRVVRRPGTLRRFFIDSHCQEGGTNSVRFRGSIDEDEDERRNADDREVGEAERRHRNAHRAAQAAPSEWNGVRYATSV